MALTNNSAEVCVQLNKQNEQVVQNQQLDKRTTWQITQTRQTNARANGKLLSAPLVCLCNLGSKRTDQRNHLARGS